MFLATVGSWAYNLATPESDVDFFLVVQPPVHRVLGLHPFEQWHPAPDEIDVKAYSTAAWIRLLLKSNPNALETLWLEDQFYHNTSHSFWRIWLNRHIFSSRQVFKHFVGYAQTQLTRMTTYSKIDVGAKRKKLIDEFGYDPKNACHVFRLLLSGIEFARTEKLCPRRTDDRDFLMGVKQGKYTLDELRVKATKLIEEFRIAEEVSMLPETPMQDVAERLLIQVQENAIRHAII